MSELRLNRLGEQIRDEIASMIMLGKIKDPRVSTFLSINRADVSRDLSYAKVYVSSFMDKKATLNGVKGLSNAAGFIQTTLSKKLRIRQFPKLEFIFDGAAEDGFKMIKKLGELENAAKPIGAERDSP